MLKTLKGDLIKLAIKGHFDVIVHGCNCKNLMNAGIARTIRENFPEAYEADTEIHKSVMWGNEYLILGQISTAFIEKRNDMVNDLTVVNAYTQFYPGPDATYIAVRDSFELIAKKIPKTSRIGIPFIGCGIGGLEWDRVEYHLNHVMKNHDVTVIEFDGA